MGSYQLTARATDNLGAVTTSSPVAINVTGQASQIYYVHNDQINTPRTITDSSGRVVWEWKGDAFGAMPPNENPSNLGSFTFNQRMPGQYYDRETNLFYNYFRDYDPAIGRYVQSDPIGLAGGINTFTYVEGNPLSFIDPEGLQVWIPPRLPPRVVEHNRWNDPNRQMGKEFGRDVFPDPNSPLPIIPQPPKPWCRLVCPSDTPNSCPVNQPIGLLKFSSTGEKCTEVCTPGPFMDSSPGSSPASSPALGPRGAGGGDWQKLIRMMR
jgi:RHS repeat-associated protein